jgi:hypothetical protein
MVEWTRAAKAVRASCSWPRGELWRLTKQYWFHFGSLISIIAFMLLGFSPVLAVFWATILAMAASTLRSDTAMIPWWAAAPLWVALAIVVADLVRIPGAPALVNLIWLLLLLPMVTAAVLGIFAPQIAPVTTRFVAALRDGTTGVLNVAAPAPPPASSSAW